MLAMYSSSTLWLVLCLIGMTIADAIASDQTPFSGQTAKDCAELVKLESILAWRNATDLTDFQVRHNLSQSELVAIEAESASEQARLDNLRSNATLVQECDTLQAAAALRLQCQELQRLDDLVQLVDNSSLLQHFEAAHDLPADWLSNLTAKANDAKTRLAQLEQNTTLVNACGPASETTSSKQGVIAKATKNAATRPLKSFGSVGMAVILAVALVLIS